MFFFPFFYATFAWLTFFVFSLSSYRAAPGAMANHLITNALLRPHGTNNPYNTLLGESAVYNNPSVSMYNAQGVLEFLSNFSSENSIFCGLFLPISFFFSSFLPSPPLPHTHFVFWSWAQKRSSLSFQCIFPFSVGFFPWAIKFTLRDTHQFYSKHSQWFWFWFFLIPLLLYCFGLVCVFCQMYPFLSLLSAHFLVKPFISEAGTPLKVSEAKMAFDTKAALVWNGREKCGQQHTSMSSGGCTRKKCQTKRKHPWSVGKNDSWRKEHRWAPKSRV